MFLQLIASQVRTAAEVAAKMPDMLAPVSIEIDYDSSCVVVEFDNDGDRLCGIEAEYGSLRITHYADPSSVLGSALIDGAMADCPAILASLIFSSLDCN